MSGTIRKADFYDIKQIANLHISALPSDFLPSLGGAFLQEIFFPICLCSNNAFTLVYETANGQINAFVVFAYDGAALTKEIVKKKVKVFYFLCKKTLKTPGFIKEIFIHLRGMILGLEKNIIDSNLNISDFPELYVIATDIKHQKK